FANRTFLNFGGKTGDTDQNAGAGAEPAVFMNLADKMLQHLLGNLEIGNNTILQGADSSNIARSPAQHALGFCADRLHDLMAIMMANSHHRRFVEYDAASANIDQGIGSAEVNGEIVGKSSAQVF